MWWGSVGAVEIVLCEDQGQALFPCLDRGAHFVHEGVTIVDRGDAGDSSGNAVVIWPRSRTGRFFSERSVSLGIARRLLGAGNGWLGVLFHASCKEEII